MAKSKVINNQMRHSIKNKAGDWKFSAAEVKLREKEAALAEALFQFFYPKAVQDVLAELPDFMLDTACDKIFLASEIHGLADPKGEYVKSGRGYKVCFGFAEGQTHRMPWPDDHGRHITGERFGSLAKPLLAKVTNYFKDRELLKKRKLTFSSGLNALLNSVRTTSKLVELMPEAAEWLPEVYHCSDMPEADQVAKLLEV